MMAGEVEGRGDRSVESAEVDGERVDGAGVEGAREDALGLTPATEIAQAVAEFARENPRVALAAAAGLGFLLGGGLSPRLLGTLGLVATRGYLRGTVTEALQGALSDQLQSHIRTG